MRTTATETWRKLLRAILTTGEDVRQEGRGHEPRDRSTKELVGHQARWPMSSPAVLCPARKVGYRFMVAEPAWILSGDNRLSSIAPYAKHMTMFSDDGVSLAGAYGPKFVDQASYVVGCLVKDPNSRQAAATLWRERPGNSKDIPCTIALQWLLRGGVLHCCATMRSSDAWLGAPYDVVAFSAMSAVVAVALRRAGAVVLGLGDLVLTCGSQHLYLLDQAAAAACAARDDEAGQVEPFDLDEFDHPDQVAEHLWSLARRDNRTTKKWLSDLPGGAP